MQHGPVGRVFPFSKEILFAMVAIGEKLKRFVSMGSQDDLIEGFDIATRVFYYDAASISPDRLHTGKMNAIAVRGREPFYIFTTSAINRPPLWPMI